MQNYPSDYNYWDENIRFREAGQVWIEAGENPETRRRLLVDLVDTLVAYGVTMQPNRATYEANRDIMRAHGLPSGIGTCRARRTTPRSSTIGRPWTSIGGTTCTTCGAT